MAAGREILGKFEGAAERDGGLSSIASGESLDFSFLC